MVQDPRQRAKIVDIFEDLMTLIIDHGVASPAKHSSQGHGPETNGSMNSMSGPPSVEPRNVSAVLLSMKTFLSARQITRWSTSKAFNVVQWSKESTKLRPRSLDFRCGSGLVITLLSDDFHTASTPSPLPSPTADTQTQSQSQTQRRPLSLRSSSGSIDSSRVPYISPSLLCRDFSQDLTQELKGRIDAASRMIATASLSTCARTLVQKTVVRSVRDDGVFHIEISCGSRPGQETADARKHQQLKGIERLVLPMSKIGDMLDEDEFLDDMYSDAAVVKAVDRILQLAQNTLSAAVPPAILITVVPYIPFATGATGHIEYTVYLSTLLLTLCIIVCLFVCLSFSASLLHVPHLISIQFVSSNTISLILSHVIFTNR
jgi:hypothetical protein